MRLASCIDDRRQPRSPWREGLMRSCQAHQHCKILAGAEPVAQALRFFGPDFSKPWPKRLDQIHLMAMLDHTPAQVMQMLCFRIGPTVRSQLARAAIGGCKSIGNRFEVDCLERPTLQRKRRIIEITRQPL